MVEKELVKLNDGSEVEIMCKRLGGRRAFQLGSQVLKITSIKSSKGQEEFSADCEMNSAVDICWNHIIVDCPQKDDVCAEDMQRIFEKYAKDQIDFVVKKNLENFKN